VGDPYLDLLTDLTVEIHPQALLHLQGGEEALALLDLVAEEVVVDGRGTPDGDLLLTADADAGGLALADEPLEGAGQLDGDGEVQQALLGTGLPGPAFETRPPLVVQGHGDGSPQQAHPRDDAHLHLGILDRTGRFEGHPHRVGVHRRVEEEGFGIAEEDHPVDAVHRLEDLHLPGFLEEHLAGAVGQPAAQEGGRGHRLGLTAGIDAEIEESLAQEGLVGAQQVGVVADAGNQVDDPAVAGQRPAAGIAQLLGTGRKRGQKQRQEQPCDPIRVGQVRRCLVLRGGPSTPRPLSTRGTDVPFQGHEVTSSGVKRPHRPRRMPAPDSTPFHHRGSMRELRGRAQVSVEVPGTPT